MYNEKKVKQDEFLQITFFRLVEKKRRVIRALLHIHVVLSNKMMIIMFLTFDAITFYIRYVLLYTINFQ